MNDDDFTAPVKQVRAEHSRIRTLAPNAERVTTLVCGSRVVAAVWPVWSPEKHLVTGLGATPLTSAHRHVPAPCNCKKRQHLVDLDKLGSVIREARVDVRRVAPE